MRRSHSGDAGDEVGVRSEWQERELHAQLTSSRMPELTAMDLKEITDSEPHGASCSQPHRQGHGERLRALKL
ncbi:hypothetical protein EYF80_051271 [Liparis tanakae]|uniref:Uncharacterized protein n=1 Tax=Liparis tanakae TaxID=230148 RepID=A0A4Z2FBD0_9TELE|nr:hypothetical protein EYF80_051271 [Liparis tanakae]